MQKTAFVMEPTNKSPCADVAMCLARNAAEYREEVMSVWRDMKAELWLLAYLIVWVAVLVLGHTMTE